jgi:CBS domain-containing protein
MSIAHVIGGREQKIISCTPQETVREATRRLAEHRIGAMPVVDGDRVTGIFSERDLLYCIAKKGDVALDMLVSEAMTAPPITADPESTVIDALEVMTLRRIRHLPVLQGGRMVAFVSIGDLVKHRLDLAETEARAMRDYIRTA